MKLSKLMGGAVAAVLITAGAGASVQAGSITFNQALTHISPPDFLFAEAGRAAIINDTSGQRSAIFSLSRFDSSLGTLDRVLLTVRQRVGSQFEDIGGNCTTGNATCFVDMTRTTGLEAQYSAGSSVNRGLGGQFTFDPSTCELSGAGSDACGGFVDYRDYTSGSTRNITDANDVLDFVGPGTFTVETLMTTTLDALPGTNGDIVSVVSSFDWSGEVIVTYEFTETSVALPAPAGAAFLMLGALALARRKRG